MRSLCLIDPVLAGRLFTWTSDWQPPTSAKLDRFFFSLEWEELFPLTFARALPYVLSNYIPILIDAIPFFIQI